MAQPESPASPPPDALSHSLLINAQYLARRSLG